MRADLRAPLVEGADKDVGTLPVGRRAPVLFVGIHALVGETEDVACGARFPRQDDSSVGCSDDEALAPFGKRGGSDPSEPLV